jgi:hypothetical protein
MISNITVEKVSSLLSVNPQGLLLFHDELVGFFGGLDRYSKGGGAGKSARSEYLSSFDGLSLPTDREGRKAPKGKGGGLCIIGGVQPDVISSLVDEGAKNDGLVQRFNFIFAKTVGRGHENKVEHSFTKYDDLIENLYERMPLANGADFHFSEKANAFKLLAFDWIALTQQLAEQDHSHFASHLGKWENIFVRFCLLFHVIDNWRDTQPRSISKDTAQRVDRLMRDYLIPHSIAFYKALGSDEEISQLRRACKHILVNGKLTITVRELQHFLGRNKNVTRQDMEKIGSKLETWDWLIRVSGKRNQHNSVQWSVRPEVFTRFANLIPAFKVETEANIKAMKNNFQARAEGKK